MAVAVHYLYIRTRFIQSSIHESFRTAAKVERWSVSL